MVRLLIIVLTVLLASTFMTFKAEAQRQGAKGVGASGQGPPACPPGVTFNMCYERCLKQSGSARTDMMKCEKICTMRGCK